MPNTYDLPTNPEECQGQIISPDLPCATHNVCVQAIDNRIFRITQELTKNQSSRVTAFSNDDVTRINSYYDDLLRLVDIAGDSIADFHGLLFWPLSDLQSIQAPVENETVNTALSYLLNTDYNLRISQSARLNDGLLPQDKTDLVDAVNKSKSIIDDFVANSNPLDQPQSSPRENVSKPS